MWISNSNKENTTFGFEVYDSENNLFEKKDGFKCYFERNKAAEISNRMALFGNKSDDLGEMTDDELLAELFA